MDNENGPPNVKISLDSGKEFDEEIDVVTFNLTLKDMLEDLDNESVKTIVIPNVEDDVFEKVLEYCHWLKEKSGWTKEDIKTMCEAQNKERANNMDPLSPNFRHGIEPQNKRSDDLKTWEKDFATTYIRENQPGFFKCVLASNFLNNRLLLTCLCKTIANSIKGRTTEEIRDFFHIKNDFTKEEEEQIKKENAWCEDR